MTQEEKDSLIVKMLSQPETLTAEETDAILADEYLCQIYSTASLLKSASIPDKDYDVEAEWTRFRPRLVKRPVRGRWYMRVAAIFFGIIILSGLIVSIINRVMDTNEATPVIADAPTDTIPLLIIKDVPLEIAEAEQVPEKSAPSDVKPQKKSDRIAQEKRKTKPQHKATQPVDEVPDDVIQQQIDLQQARVDNEVAQSLAELYMIQYYTMQMLNGQEPEMPVVRTNYNETQSHNNSFMKVVMQ